MIFKKIIYMLITAASLAGLASCSDTPEYPDDPAGNFEALVEIIDTKYCFLDSKGIDWQQTADRYRKELRPDMKAMELFDLCSRMLAELKDGHVNLSSRFDVSYYRKWWSDYPQDFNLRTLQQYYLGFDYRNVSGMSYKILREGVGYIYFPSFSTAVSETSLDYVLAYMEVNECETLIIDIRNNGGGLLTNVGTFVGRFIDHEVTGGFIRHKTGPGHNEFSEPYRFTYKPADKDKHVKWDKPIFLLTNRSCFSAANDFTAVMKSLPQVTVIGARTGGGGGMPFTSELPNGWSIRFSACPINSPADEDIEGGIDPSEGCEVHCTAGELAAGQDAILDFALKKASAEQKPQAGK